MTRPLALKLLTCVLTVTLSSFGCHQSYYQQPYTGYGGYGTAAPYGGTYPQGTYPQGTYPAPIQTLTPGQPYVPGGMGPSTIPQGGATPTYQQPSGLQPIPDNNSAPTYSPNTSPLAPSPYVPGASISPINPGYSAVQPMNSPSGIQPAGFSSPSALNPPAAGLREVRSASTPDMTVTAPANPLPASPHAMPIESFAAPKMGPPPAIPSASHADPFANASVPASAGPFEDVKANKVENAVLSAFAHDPKFQWLRGVVSREPRDGTWSIIYNDAPSAADRWAGHLSLSPSPELETLKDGDVVQIRGQIDSVVKDHLGKPVYVVTGVEKVTVVK